MQNFGLLYCKCKKDFCEAPKRVEIFESIAPDISLPPEPVITRWGTWINAAIYYAENNDVIKKVVNSLDSNDSVAIANIKDLNSNEESKIMRELLYVNTHLNFIPNAIKNWRHME